MTLTRTWSAAIVVAVVTLGGVGGVAAAQPTGQAIQPMAAGAAQPVAPFQTPTFRGAVYGDFAEIGNGVLRCPQTGDQPAPSAQDIQSCQQASQRQQGNGSTPDDNAFYLQLNQDTASQLFDQGQAQLTLPPGATVRYAQLNWGGNTGQSDMNILRLGQLDISPTMPLPSCAGSSSVLGVLPNLQSVLQPARLPPSPPAAAGPQQQDVELSIGTTQTGPGTPVSVPPTHYAVAGQNTQMYSAYADVTNTVAEAVDQAALTSTPSPTSALPTTFTTTVGDVWAVSGHGCAAGWSLDVVFGYPQPPTDPDNPYTHLREVDVYSDQVGQEPGATTSLAINGLNDDANAAGVEVGVTAYGGDINSSGQFTVGGQAQNDPCSTATDGSADFFSSCALGALDPITPGVPILNNFSVDAKAIEPAISSTSSPPGPAVDLGMSGAADPYLLQTVVLSEYINPRLTVTVSGPAKVHNGDSVPVTVTMQNTGDVPLYNPTISNVAPASVFPSQCQGMENPSVLAPGHSQTFTCTGTAHANDFSATATAAAQYRPDDPSSQISASSSMTVQILRPIVSVALSANSPAVRAGQPVTLTFTVANNSDPAEGTLDATLATNPALSGCAPAPVHIPSGYEAMATCTFTPSKDMAVTATATATDASNAHASATSTPVRIAVIHPSLSIAVAPDPTDVSPGEPVSFTVVVHNTGDVPLAVTVSDDEFARFCDFSNTQLPAGAAQSQTCTVPAPTTAGPFTDDAQFTANPVGKTSSGVPITGPAADSSIHGRTAGTAIVQSGGGG